MSEIRELMRRHTQPGRVDWIGLRPARLAPVETVTKAELTETGLLGDHHQNASPRALTLIQAEHLEVIAQLTRTRITPEMLRRNIVIAGINLIALRHDRLRLGSAEIKLTKPCAPCSRMEKVIGPGGYNAMRGHGGWYAEVTVPGAVTLADQLTPIAAS